MTRGLERKAKTPNMNVDRSFFDKDMVAPNPIEKFATGQHAVGVAQEVVQQPEFSRAEF